MYVIQLKLIIFSIITASHISWGVECPAGYFDCGENKCVNLTWVCDGDIDCENFEDERGCEDKPDSSENCAVKELKCEDGIGCIPIYWKCDGEKDCLDGSDEIRCNETECFGLKCGNICLPEEFVCDEEEDCDDGFDEKHCSDEAVSCRADEISCPLTSRCISRNFICDGNADCPDERDEENCTKSRPETVSPYRTVGNEIIFVSDGSAILVQERTDVNESSKWNFTLPSAMISGLAFDNTMKRLFVADLKIPVIYAFNLTSLKGEKLVENRLISPGDIAFDFMSNNLYWVDSEKGTVEVASVTNRKRVIVLADLEQPVSLALSSFSGNMFISTIGDEVCVAMYGMDGKNKRILNSVQGLPISLALHPSKSILYWTDPRAGIIFYFNYTSSRSPWILKNGINGLMSVAISDDNLYWTASDEPRQSEIAGGVYVQSLSVFRNGTHWRRIAHSSGNSFSGKSHCLINNGDCSYLCLTSQNGRTCACSSAMTLAENRRHCYGKKCKGSDFKCIDGECVPGEMKCDGNIDCNDGSDELNCTTQIPEDVAVHKALIHGLLKPERTSVTTLISEFYRK